jgi:tetratricopeptide (TPR) repeat protein
VALDNSTQVGRQVCLGRYRVLAHIASGAMGAVYRALDSESGREVALKVLLPQLVAGKPEVVERFRREALHGARLSHENVVALYEFGEAGGVYYFAMELVEGLNLHDQIEATGPLEPEEARRIVGQVARALDHAHRQGLVHRDVKPANVLLTRTGEQVTAKLADFGLARVVHEEEFRLTRDGSTVGTVDYMSPEQARSSAAADIRSDIYSLGCTFFHMLSGAPPFGEGSLTERIYKHLDTEPPDIQTLNPDVPADLAAVLRRMLAKKPTDRYQTPAELLDALFPKPQPVRPVPAPEPPRAPQPRPAPPEEAPVPAGPPARAAERETVRPPRAVRSAADAPARERIAAGQFEWASEQLARGNRAYGIELLLGCCRLDPTNLDYHRALRLATKGRRGGRGWLGWLRGLVSRLRLKWAVKSGDHARVLALGEEVLARDPANLYTQLAMASAAGGLGAEVLALWLLEQARRQDKSDRAVNRALGLYHESRKEYPEATRYWEAVARAAPGDSEAAAKLRNLAALLTLERNQRRQTTEREPDLADR